MKCSNCGSELIKTENGLRLYKCGTIHSHIISDITNLCKERAMSLNPYKHQDYSPLQLRAGNISS